MTDSALAATGAGGVSKDVKWYDPVLDPKIISPALRDLLVEYSGVAPAAIEAHLYAVRDIAWSIFPFPCIGEWWFITLGLSSHPHYPTLLSRLRASSAPPVKLLDLGACLGQDLRKLLHDGAPLESLHSCDILPAFEGAGHVFFNDAGSFKDRFFAADLFDEASDAPLNRTAGTWDVITTVMFLHQFDAEEALQASKRILQILSPKPGSMIVGIQVASVSPRRQKLPPELAVGGEERYLFLQSKETFREMWDTASKEANVRVKIEAEYGLRRELGETEVQGDERERKLAPGPDRRRLFFVIERLE